MSTAIAIMSAVSGTANSDFRRFRSLVALSDRDEDSVSACLWTRVSNFEPTTDPVVFFDLRIEDFVLSLGALLLLLVLERLVGRAADRGIEAPKQPLSEPLDYQVVLMRVPRS
jgi:hypothetical protein